MVNKKFRYFLLKLNKNNNYNGSEKSTEKYLYEVALNINTNNVVKRHMISSCIELMKYESSYELIYDKTNKNYITLPNNWKRNCYGCNEKVSTFHYNYVFSCVKCGTKFEKYRHFITPQTNKIALISGARTKLGHQIVIKLLKSGCVVIGTTRNPNKMKEIYKQYSEYSWINNLMIYPESLDFDTNHIEQDLIKLKEFIQINYGKLDILINSASQTIRCREKYNKYNKLNYNESNRYNDSKYLDSKYINSWNMRLNDFEQDEMEEIFRINIIAPTLMIKTMMDLLKKSDVNPYIINVHAREGLITVAKNDKHMHTNFGKTSMHMLTKCLASSSYKTDKNKRIYIHGCDPGWISIDEYYENNRPWIVPPCDEIDGASKVLYPLFMNLRSEQKTRRQYDELLY